MSKDLAEMPAIHFTGEDIMSGALPTLLARAAMEHGPIFRLPIHQGYEAGQQFIFMVGPEANRFVFHTHRDHFSHDLGWTPLIGEDLGRGLLNMDDPEHARHRKMWNPAFTNACMEAYLPIIARVIDERTRRWPERDSVDVYDEARQITFDAAAAALAGFQPGPEVDRLRELFYVLLHGFDPGQETWETFINHLRQARHELAGMLLTMIHARRAASEDEQPRDVLGMIVRARDEQGAALSDEQVLAHLNILLVAGHETTTTLGAWALYLLATEPEHREQARAEVETLLVDGARDLSVEAVRGMRFLDSFIREAGRLYSPVINVPRGVVKTFEFGGYTVPAGTQIRLALAASHRLPHIFADPDRFDPDRLAPPREEDRRHQYSLVTFGGGSRICIGINFANIEVKALAAHVLRCFDLEAVSGQHPTHAGHWNANVPEGIHLRVTRRHQPQ
jgi:retinoid hydroxylase